MKRLAVPFGSYIAVMVGVPLLNGALQDTAFFGHAATVIVIPLIILSAFRLLLRARRRRDREGRHFDL